MYGFRACLLEALELKLKAVDLSVARKRGQSADDLAERMLATVPTILITDPPVGYCYTTRALSIWRGVSRQAIFNWHRDRKVLAFKHGGVLVYPATQFHKTGRPRAAMATLLATSSAPRASAREAATWLQTPNDATGRTPLQELAATDADGAGARTDLPELAELTLECLPTSQQYAGTPRPTTQEGGAS